MTPRPGWLLCALMCLGCQSVTVPEGEIDAETVPTQGDACTNEGPRPVGFFDKELFAFPTATRSHLSLAAEQLARGNESAAAEHLGKYLADHPDHHEVRLYYAELLLRLERRRDAAIEFTRYLDQAEERGSVALRDRIHCHSRLMAIADAEDDEYMLHLHRGLGMYLLALERVKLGDPDGQLPVEGLLCRAAGELTTARNRRSDAAQPCWYLYRVWSALGQHNTALRWLERAKAAAQCSMMTPAEQRGLELACRQSETWTMRP
jgi:tetratricopeptide (TPR) repeat protein